jgi:hypothetical protein
MQLDSQGREEQRMGLGEGMLHSRRLENWKQIETRATSRFVRKKV